MPAIFRRREINSISLSSSSRLQWQFKKVKISKIGIFMRVQWRVKANSSETNIRIRTVTFKFFFTTLDELISPVKGSFSCRSTANPTAEANYSINTLINFPIASVLIVLAPDDTQSLVETSSLIKFLQNCLQKLTSTLFPTSFTSRDSFECCKN